MIDIVTQSDQRQSSHLYRSRRVGLKLAAGLHKLLPGALGCQHHLGNDSEKRALTFLPDDQ